MAIDHLPTFPAREQQNADDNERQDEALGYDRSRAFGVARIPVINLDQHHEHVTARVLKVNSSRNLRPLSTFCWQEKSASRASWRGSYPIGTRWSCQSFLSPHF